MELPEELKIKDHELIEILAKQNQRIEAGDDHYTVIIKLMKMLFKNQEMLGKGQSCLEERMDGMENYLPSYLKRIEEAAQVGFTLGLEVHAGHGLNLQNVGYIAEIEEISELNIGHSIISRSINVGIERAVSEMKERILLGV